MGQAEHMIEIYHRIAFVCGGLAVLLFAGAVFLFFWFRIPRTLDFLSGRSARRSVRQMRREMEPGLGRNERTAGEFQMQTEMSGDETTLFLKGPDTEKEEKDGNKRKDEKGTRTGNFGNFA